MIQMFNVSQNWMAGAAKIFNKVMFHQNFKTNKEKQCLQTNLENYILKNKVIQK